MRIFAFHLFNDYSGSPKVLMQLIKGWTSSGIEVNVVTSAGRKGFLSELEDVGYHYFPYKWKSNPLLRLWMLLYSQAALILMMFRRIKKHDIVYINTVLPFGAAVLGKLKGCRVIYHIHETSVKPRILKRFLFGLAKWASDDVVYVSNYLSMQESFNGTRSHLLYNALENQFLTKASGFKTSHIRPENVLMVCSLKDYKGVKEFVTLASDNANLKFRLVVNDTNQNIREYFSEINMPSNLDVFNTQTDLHPFYQWADLVVNLSRPDAWIETFGLTIIEGMAYGLPAIVPPVGGITELIEDYVNGFKVDCRHRDELNHRIKELQEDTVMYGRMCIQAKTKASHYSEELFVNNSLAILRSY